MSNDNVTDEELKSLVIARLKSMPENMKISIGNEGTFSIDQLVNEVKSDTEVGRTVVDIQLEFLKALKTGELLNAS